MDHGFSTKTPKRVGVFFGERDGLRTPAMNTCIKEGFLIQKSYRSKVPKESQAAISHTPPEQFAARDL